MSFLFGFLLVVTALFLIMIVLLQRGRGGGLAGAFGGMGGQSAFGAKAGDLFTRITIGVATFWILLCITSVKVLSSPSQRLTGGTQTSTPASGTTTTGAKTGTAAKSGALSTTSTPAAPATSQTSGAAKTDTGAKSDAGTSGTSPAKPEKPAEPPSSSK